MMKQSERWSEQEIRRVAAESMTDVRTVKRALSGRKVRTNSKARILAAAQRLKLALFSIVFAGCGLTPEPSPSLFGGDDAGTEEDATIETTRIADGMTPDVQEDAEGDGGTDGQPADASSCEGVAGGFIGCQSTGCHVCVENVALYPKYFANHPGCVALPTCIAGVYGVCAAHCPAPTAADQ